MTDSQLYAIRTNLADIRNYLSAILYFVGTATLVYIGKHFVS